MSANATSEERDKRRQSSGDAIVVIACACNAVSFLQRFFECIARQTCTCFTLVFVDDASSDATFEMASELGSALPQPFVLLRSPQRLGLVGARNLGLEWASRTSAEYLSFLDVDDWFEPAYLHDLHAAAQAADADLCIAGIVRYEEETGKVLATEMVDAPTYPISDSSSCSHLAFVNPCSYAKLFRFAPIRDLRFRQVVRSEDTCYLFDALPALRRVAFTNRALYHYRVADGTLTSLFDAKAHESMHQVFAQMLPAFEEGERALYRDLFQVQAFIRSSVGGVLRRVQRGESAIDLARAERAWLDAQMPGWRTNPYLSFGHAPDSPPKQRAIALCAQLYRVRAFAVAPHVYALAQHMFDREVRL